MGSFPIGRVHPLSDEDDRRDILANRLHGSKNVATEQAKVKSCFIVPSSNWLGGHPFKVEIGVRVSVG